MPSTQDGTPNSPLVSDTALLALAMSDNQSLRQQLSTAAIETNRLKAEVNTLKAKGRDQEMKLLANKSRIEELQQREMLLPGLKAQFTALDASDVTDRLNSDAVAAGERSVDLLARAVEAEHELEKAENERDESEKLVKRLLTSKDQLHKDVEGEVKWVLKPTVKPEFRHYVKNQV